MLNIFSYVHLPSVESLNCMEIKWVNPKGNPCWIYIGRTDAEAPILWPRDAKNWLMEKDPEERLKAGGEGDDRGWDGWMASPIQWPRVWASSRSWWWTGKLGMLQSMGSQRVGHDWETELMSSLQKCLFSFFVHFFLLGCLFFWYWAAWAAYVFWRWILCQLFHLLLFSPILKAVFSPCL